MAFKIYNTLGRKLEEFVPVVSTSSTSGAHVGFYGCGPTVYNFAHIGNLRAYLTHDTLVRSLRRRGYQVTHVMNITDVGHLTGDNDEGEDKMVKAAGERHKSVLEIAAFYTEAFFKDTERLNIKWPDIVCKATEHIDEMIALIKRIEANGYTYSAGGNLYFDTAKFDHYWELSGRNNINDEETVSRTGLDANKKHPADFVLWFTKSKFIGQDGEGQALVWDSPWGTGYPGWHIECSAMSMKYLGEQFDIHAGGIDHVAIHHSNEIAQSEAATGKHPWVKYWVHNEFLVLDKGKMSKSAGGFLTLQTLIDKGFDPLDYRYLVLGAHYRSQLQFSWEALEGARASRLSLLDKIKSHAEARRRGGGATQSNSDPASPRLRVSSFDEALDDDLNTPRALAALWAAVKEGDLDAVYDMDTVLGLGLKEAVEAADNQVEVDPVFAAEIEGLIAERSAAKKAKDWAKADSIRAAIKAKGVVLTDNKDGSSSWSAGSF
ncbi:MAG: cysteine--tRNA ligase [Spirochaetaceae bacterium]|jgi:cysteinyl-tRNA synthetase|nr:cysteine--tRNA ligase [Spirochaetaceae bacterium]